ncbi:MAG TPA: EpsI family protein, partial [Rhodocyclaceae bacterium]|nr:EpsI family protein [Rhodocyclaceae bacterium]
TQRLVGKLGGRTEPITYWITLDDKVTLPGFGRKVQQMKFGLRGKIPDGMLVRVSSLTDDEAGAFLVQEQFVKALFGSLPADFRPRYFGT